MDWNDLRYFLAVARTGSLSDAAKLVGASASTVARRIMVLEEALTASLFVRHSRGYLLTDEGKALASRLDSIEQDIRALEGATRGSDQELSGTVRVASSIALVNDILVPAMAQFRSRYPGIQIDVSSGIENISLSKREADIALRLTQPRYGRLRVRTLASMGHGVYAAHRYLEARGLPASAQALKSADFIVWGEAHQDIPIARWLAGHVSNPNVALVANDITTHIQAVRCGVGVGVLPAFLAAGDESLACLVPPDAMFERKLYLVIHEDVQASARVRLVADFIADTVQASAARFMGQV